MLTGNICLSRRNNCLLREDSLDKVSLAGRENIKSKSQQSDVKGFAPRILSSDTNNLEKMLVNDNKAVR